MRQYQVCEGVSSNPVGFATEEPLAGLPRVAPKGGVTIGGTYFPQGVTLTVNPSVIHNSKEIWGPDAREFNPDRWLRPDAAEKEKCFIPVSLQILIFPLHVYAS